MKTDKLITLGSVFILGFAAGFITLDNERRALADELSAAKARENSVIVQAMENCPPPAVMDFAMIETEEVK